jgi:DNA mismatch endonuclease, patch repair protein
MTDVFSPAKRSAIMSAIKSKGTKTTELAVRRLFRAHGIKGWRAHLKTVPGQPDFAFPTNKLAIFIDGCFWHGCRTCKRNLRPSTNADFWLTKFAANRTRDRLVTSVLRKKGWKVLRFWEHQVRKSPVSLIMKIASSI